MSAAALFTMIFGLLLTWGGATLCIYGARGKRTKKGDRPFCKKTRHKEWMNIPEDPAAGKPVSAEKPFTDHSLNGFLF